MERCVEGKVYVAEDGPPILGWRHQYDLDIKLTPRAAMQVSVVGEWTLEQVLQAMEEVFAKQIGKLRGYEHRIVVKKGAISVQHKVRRVPMAARQKVHEMLEEMDGAGVIECIESSPWVSLVVITQTSDGNLRFCVDLRTLNQNIVVDTYPLPNINKLILLLK